MRRAAVLIVAALCSGGALTPLVAQKTAPPVTRDADHDGVPDPFDRCPNTPAGAHADANGCAPGQPGATTAAAPAAPGPAAPAVSGAAPGHAAAAPPAAAPTASATSATSAVRGAPSASQPGIAQQASPGNAAAPPAGGANHPAGNAAAPGARPGAPAPPAATVPGSLPNVSLPSAPPPVAVTGAPGAASRPNPPPAATAAPARPVVPTATVDASLTGGYMMPPWVANTRSAVPEYVRSYLLKLDSATVALRAIFTNIVAQPVEGATDPTRLVSREKLRWRNCRNLKNDFQSFADVIAPLRDSMPTAMKDRWLDLGDRFDSLQNSLEYCETIAFMIESPERYQPWQQNYENAAHAFYADWYTHLRAMHEAARTIARIDAQLVAPEHRASLIIPILPPTAPTLGGH